MTAPANPFTLAHWRGAVTEIYADVRRAPPDERERACAAFRAVRDELFRSHPQSPLAVEAGEQVSG
ncbi:MAG: hypothetical protein ACJ8CR_04105 [Roseiflexaceae bacterium]